MANETKKIGVRLHFDAWDTDGTRHAASPAILSEDGLPQRNAFGATKRGGEPIMLDAETARALISDGKAEAAV
jgi:hypothetical protein